MTGRTSNRSRSLLRLGSLALIVVAAISLFRELKPHRDPLPMLPLRLSPELTPSAVVPAAPGSLAGRNVLLVTLDTTRPDRLGAYGNSGIATPTLDRLAANGVVFSNALATAPTTLPTHASILTGLYPAHHGARTNGLFRLDDDRVTLAEVLSRHGYDTAAFVSSFVLDGDFGLAQGFDHYDDDVGPKSREGLYAERRADETTDRAIAWLARRRDRPAFAWVHYYDPHVLYDAPPPFSDRSESPYDAEIAFVDHQLGRLLASLESGARDWLVVVTADHGEALGEAGEWTHGYLVQEATIKIPLILHAPGALDGGFRVDTRASQVDLVPTIASLLGVAAPPALDGVDLTRSPDPKRSILAEAVEGQANYGWAPLTAFYEGPYKYVDGPQPQLFDLSHDPLERSNLVEERPGDVTRLRRRLSSHAAPGGEGLAVSNVELDAEDVQRLESLGYLVTAGGAKRPDRSGADPKQVLPILNRLLDLVTQFDTDATMAGWQRLAARATGRTVMESRADLIRELEILAEEHPDFAPTYRYLAFYYHADGRVQDAERAKQTLAALVGSPSGG